MIRRNGPPVCGSRVLRAVVGIFFIVLVSVNWYIFTTLPSDGVHRVGARVRQNEQLRGQTFHAEIDEGQARPDAKTLEEAFRPAPPHPDDHKATQTEDHSQDSHPADVQAAEHKMAKPVGAEGDPTANGDVNDPYWKTGEMDDGTLSVVDDRDALVASQQLIDVRKGMLGDSKLLCFGGRMSGVMCDIKNLALLPNGTFVARASPSLPDSIHKGMLAPFVDMSVFRRYDVRTSMSAVACDAYVHVRSVSLPFFYYYTGNSWHLHVDTMMPLFSHLEAAQLVPSLLHTAPHGSMRSRAAPAPLLMLPAVMEKRIPNRRHQALSWDSPAYDDPHRYYMDQMQLLSDYPLMPLHSSVWLKSNRTVCFDSIILGRPHASRLASARETLSAGFIPTFARFVQHRLGVPRPRTPPTVMRVGLIKRTNRRRITNEPELVAACARDNIALDLVTFNGRFRDQVALTGTYSVLIGVNGAGLMNCIYAAPGAVCVQIGPYGAKNLNFTHFGQHLSARGPYIMWHQTHRENSSNNMNHTRYDQSDSRIDPDEFRVLVKSAIDKVGQRTDLFARLT